MAEKQKTFEEVFKENMEILHLPILLPKNAYESIGAALGTVAALSAVIKVGDKPIMVILTQAGMAGAAAGGAAAAGEVLVAVGAIVGSVYVGLLASALVTAAWEVHGPAAAGAIAQLAGIVSSALGQSLDELVRASARVYPAATGLAARLMHPVRISTGASGGTSVPRGSSGPRRWGR